MHLLHYIKIIVETIKSSETIDGVRRTNAIIYWLLGSPQIKEEGTGHGKFVSDNVKLDLYSSAEGQHKNDLINVQTHTRIY